MRLQVSCEDRMGLARALLTRLEENAIDLRGIEIDHPGGAIYLHLPALDFACLQQLMPEIRRIAGVLDVKTVPFMPSEREHQEMEALMKALPDLVFALDDRARINHVSEAVLSLLRLEKKEILGLPAASLLKGFPFSAWLADPGLQAEIGKLEFAGEAWLGEIRPLRLAEPQGLAVLVGALVVLKSSRRSGPGLHRQAADADSRLEQFTAESPVMQALLHQARRQALQDLPLLIQGETGTGKEMLARACHHASLRARGPLVILNCAALPDEVLEHELFGSSAGAFGPQWPGKLGLLEQASGGSFLLDEVAEMSPLLQSKLLRVLEDGRFHRVGQQEEVRVDVRILATSRHVLAERVQQGLFREDLFFRLSVLSLEMPPLRHRQADIVPLAQQCVARICEQLQRARPRLPRRLLECLSRYRWPGNVRQLKNALYQALTLLDGEELTPEALRLPMLDNQPEEEEAWFEGSLQEAGKRFERAMLERLYPSHPSSRQLAKRLGISHTAVANKLREHGLGKPDEQTQAPGTGPQR